MCKTPRSSCAEYYMSYAAYCLSLVRATHFLNVFPVTLSAFMSTLYNLTLLFPQSCLLCFSYGRLLRERLSITSLSQRDRLSGAETRFYPGRVLLWLGFRVVMRLNVFPWREEALILACQCAAVLFL